MFPSLKLLILGALLTRSCCSFVRFTNLKCKHFDADFAVFSKCYIKLIKRSTVALNVHVKLFQIPVTNVSINLSLHRKFSGYRPFLYNISFDFCHYLRNRKQYPFMIFFHEIIFKYSNINHSCPYDHDIIVKDCILNEDMFKFLPLPKGDYMLQFKVAAYNDWKADVKAYLYVDLGYND